MTSIAARYVEGALGNPWCPRGGSIPTRRPVPAVAAAFQVGTGGLLTARYVAARNDRGYRLPQFDHDQRNEVPAERRPVDRDAVENLARVREVFRPSVTELAAILRVSRQAVYNWQSGQPVAEENDVRLAQLARAADLLVAEGLAGQANVLRRKLPGGKTLFERVRAGEAADAAAVSLVELIRHEHAQGRAMADRLAGRKRRAIDVDDVGSPHLDETN
jgi:transcriptional regulator with XRE-family HTH domain